MLDADIRELAAARTLGAFTTLMPDGTPQTSLVWPHADDEHVLVGTNDSRQKYRNVVADPRVNILLMDSVNSRRYIEIRGRVVAVEPGEAALALARTTFTKWTGSDRLRDAEGERVLLRIVPDRVHRKE
ncbi:TIGR03618 family F420-dependent PPOX class oxidoreductase [Streptomyces sp. NPDC002690]